MEYQNEAVFPNRSPNPPVNPEIDIDLISPDARPFKCPLCHVPFRRSEHLQRHIKLHTGEKKYQCPCGDTFSRKYATFINPPSHLETHFSFAPANKASDVLARHLRRCEKGASSQERLMRARSTKQTRAKRACDQCAKSKSKCDFQQPCYSCCRKYSTCAYTREGRLDPYASYSIGHASQTAVAVNDSTNWSSTESSNPGLSEGEAAAVSTGLSAGSNAGSLSPLTIGLLHTNSPQLQAQVANLGSGVHLESVDSQIHLNQSEMFGLDIDPRLGFDFAALFDNSIDMNPTSLNFDMAGPFESVGSPTAQSQTRGGRDDSAVHRNPQRSPWGSFLLNQIDPVEAKCVEIRDLLKGSEPLVANDIITECVTRENLILFSGCYGKHFQRNFPVLHAPTFNLIDTSPILLLAIMLVGSCYADGVVPAAHITRLAMRLLILIENQPHEINMHVPALSTIQASTAVSALLACSRSDIACKFVSNYFARNISMAKRAHVFDPVDSVDYNTLTEETFDWRLWIEQESKRRIACEIFSQDMAGCIFQNSSPSFAPLDFNLELPCYESCWEAKTASECLERLQNMPRQVHVSTAIRQLRAAPVTGAPLFEASGFGMFVLVKSLHCLLFQATQYDIELSDSLRSASSDPILTPGLEIPDLDSRLQQDLSGPTVASLADEAVSLHGSSTLKYINSALNAWRVTWDLRHYRDLDHENRTFVSDPLPFWWLAKLYIVLHYYNHLIPENSEFAIPRAKGVDEKDKIQIQSKIVGWLSRFRTQRLQTEPSKESWLSKLIKPSEDE